CLTVVKVEGGAFAFEAGFETLARTNLGGLRPGDRVNLERALRVGDRLGGHFVTGHVDCTGRVVERVANGEWETVWFGFQPALRAEDSASRLRGAPCWEPAMIEVVSVTQHYGVRPVLRDVSLSVARGGVTAVIGPNGMGKSTLLGVMAGVLTPQHGYVTIDG